MKITLDLPDDVAREMGPEVQGLSRVALESIALEGYRSGRLSEEQVRRLLRFESRFDVHAFLKAHGVYLNYTQEDLEQDLATARSIGE